MEDDARITAMSKALKTAFGNRAAEVALSQRDLASGNVRAVWARISDRVREAGRP